ncbi:MAG: hypothetical protein ACFB00_03715 [Parvularculaceae bacterium]
MAVGATGRRGEHRDRRKAPFSDTRIGVGVGPVERISKKNLSLSTGEAFTLSGRALDAMTNTLLAVAVDEPLAQKLGPLTPWLSVIGGLSGELASSWTASQADTVALAAHPSAPTHEVIAEKLGVSRQSVSKTLDSAHWRALESAIDAFENVEWGDA